MSNRIAKFISYKDVFINRSTPLIEDVSSEPVNFTSEPLNQIVNQTISKPAPVLEKYFPTLWDAKEKADVNEGLSMPLNDAINYSALQKSKMYEALNYPFIQKSEKLSMEVAEFALSETLNRIAIEAPLLQSNYETAHRVVDFLF